MRKYITGIIIGIILSTTAFATTTEYILKPITYDITVNGESLQDPNYPMLNYEGTTYLSLRKTAETVGAEINWNEETKTAELNTTSKGSGDMEIKNSPIRSNSIEDVLTEDFMYILKDNEYYLPIRVFADYYKATDTHYIIDIPNKIKLELDKNNKYSNELIIKYGGLPYIKISGLGITAEFKDNVLWIE